MLNMKCYRSLADWQTSFTRCRCCRRMPHTCRSNRGGGRHGGLHARQCEFRDRRAVFAEMNRILRPQGRLLLDHAQWRWPFHGRPVTLAVDVSFVPYQHKRLWFGFIERLEARKPT